MNRVGIVLVLLVLFAVGGYFLVSNSDGQSESESTAPRSAEDVSQPKEDKPANEGALITYTTNGFSPETLRVSVGDKLTVKNNSNRTIQFDSDPHPAHTDNRELNIDHIRPGSSKAFTVSRTGTFGYHDHLNPSARGEIIVE